MKALGGGGGSFSKTTHKAAPKAVEKPKPKPKALSHSQLVAQWEQQGRDANGKLIKYVEKEKKWTKEDIDRARAAKEKAEEEARNAEKPKMTPANEAGEELVVLQGLKASELARTRMAKLADNLECMSLEGDETAGMADGVSGGGGGSSSAGDAACSQDAETMQALVESRRAQLEELTLIEAMFPEEFRMVSDAATVEALRAALETLEGSADDVDALQVVAAHTDLEFALQMTAEFDLQRSSKPPPEDPAVSSEGEARAQEKKLVGSLLFRVRFPREYLSSPTSYPRLYVEDALFVEAEAELTADKVLSTCAVLDEGALVTAMLGEAEELLPGPCVFQMVSWMQEHVSEFVSATWV